MRILAIISLICFILFLGLTPITPGSSAKLKTLTQTAVAQSVNTVQTDAALPALRGDPAINKLRERGQYDSLMESLRAARNENTQTADAIGQSIKLTATGGAADDFFGASVAISGDTAIVGASEDDRQGSAYVFVRSGTGWSQQAKLTAVDGAAVDRFGASVAISGDTAIVGAYLDDVGANSNQGSAYVFVRSGKSWSQQGQLTAADGAADDLFGHSVAISGDTAIAGAYQDDVGPNADQGSAYVFVRSRTGWSQYAKLTAPDGAAFDLFGLSVGIGGDTVIVGEHGGNVGANINQGSAYVFVRSGTGWSQQAKLTAADGAVDDLFGISVAISGDTAIVGAYADDIGANSDQGSAYVFVRSGTRWSQQAKLTAADGAAGDRYFGASVAISGETAIVGAEADEVRANSNQGSAYVFVRSGTGWSQQAKLTAADGAGDDKFGCSVAVSGNYFFVGAISDDVGTNSDQGSAYIFVRSGKGWSHQAQLTATGGGAGDRFGSSVAVSGDTAIVGAWSDDVGTNSDQGSAYIFVHSGKSWSQQAQLTAADGAAGDLFGASVAINGETAIVGAFGDDVGTNSNQGSAYIFVRSGTGWSQQAQLVASGDDADSFGWSVAISGETAIVGAYADDVGTNIGQGSAFIFVRSGTGWSQQAQLTAADGAALDDFGGSVAITGDTAIVGAYRDDLGANSNQGSAYIFVRSGTSWSQQAKLTAAGGAANDRFGKSVAISGDTAIVGASEDDRGTKPRQGSAYVFVRWRTRWSQQAKLTAAGGTAGDRFGASVAISGETAIVGASSDHVRTNRDQGSAYVFGRSRTKWSQQAQLTATDGEADDWFGVSVAISGDTAIVGTSIDPGTNSDQGSAYVFFRSRTRRSQKTMIPEHR